jgi:putative redox protein
MEAKAIWQNEGLVFEGVADTGVVLPLASGMDEGVKGFRPMELLGIGLAGCTGMDVISILKKKRQQVSSFEVKVNTESAETHPHVWTKVEIEYLVKGKDIDPKAIQRAMDLSRDRYCPAQNMINKAVEIDLKYTIIEE